MKRFLKPIIAIFIIGIVVFFGIKKIKSKKEELKKTPTANLPVYTVNGAKINSGCIDIWDEYIGMIKPDKSINISSKLTGFIEKVFVKENDIVKKGETIVKLDCKQVKLQMKNLLNLKYSMIFQLNSLKNQLNAQKARLDYLKNKYLRDKNLIKQNAISQERFELSKSNYLSALAELNAIKSNITSLNKKIKSVQAQLNNQKHNLNYCKISAPINGVVTKVYLYKGDLSVPGKPILNIETTKNYKILVNIPMDKATSIKNDTPVKIFFNNKIVAAKIKKIYPSAPNNSLITIEIRIDKLPKNIPTNSYVLVKILHKTICGIKVPLNSILNLSNGNYVLAYKNKKFIKEKVTILGSNDKFAIVKGDLKENQVIAVAEENKLRLISMGVKVKLNKNKAKR